METEPDEFIPTRRSLITRLRHWDDQEGWQRFFDTYWRMIYSIARRSGLNDADAQDVVMLTVEAVAERMPKFKYDPGVGSFKGWLAQVTRRRIIDLLRKRNYQNKGRQFAKEEPLAIALAEVQPGPTEAGLDGIWNEEWTNHLRETALEKAKRLVSPAHYQMFHYHVVKNVPAKEVAALLEVELPEVYYAKKKISEILQKEVRRLEQGML